MQLDYIDVTVPSLLVTVHFGVKFKPGRAGGDLCPLEEHVAGAMCNVTYLKLLEVPQLMQRPEAPGGRPHLAPLRRPSLRPAVTLVDAG